jgi:hypothetical protein
MADILKKCFYSKRWFCITLHRFLHCAKFLRLCANFSFRIFRITTSMTRWVCEKSRPNFSPTLYPSKLIHKRYCGKNWPILCAISAIIKTLIKENNLPKRRYSAQSGHPDHNQGCQKPKIPIWVNFVGLCNGKCWDILRVFGLFYGHWKYLIAIWYIF